MAERLIWIPVGESGSGPGATFTFHVRLDGDAIAANRALTPSQLQAVRDLSRQYGQLFEQRRMPQLMCNALATIGTQLFDRFFWRRSGHDCPPA